MSRINKCNLKTALHSIDKEERKIDLIFVDYPQESQTDSPESYLTKSNYNTNRGQSYKKDPRLL